MMRLLIFFELLSTINARNDDDHVTTFQYDRGIESFNQILSNGQLSTPGNEIRFSSKIQFPDDVYQTKQDLINNMFPLGSEHYPHNQTLYEFLKDESLCHSVMHPENDYEAQRDIDTIIEAVGGHPNHAPKQEFWPEFEEVVDLQITRRAKGLSLASDILPWFPLPALWSTFSVNDVAEAVHTDFPGMWHSQLIYQILGSGITLDNDIIPKRSKVQFLHGPVLLADINTWAITIVGPTSFVAKYYVGRARPEEVAFSITNNDFNSNDVPTSIVEKITSMDLVTMEEFTAYDEGCPVHPSWPAMHSAASALSMWLPVVTKLTDSQLEETKRMDLAIAMGRTVAGVHYKNDNIAGLNMGQEVLAMELPRYLAKKYGADPIKVKRKIDTVRFNWVEESVRLMPGF